MAETQTRVGLLEITGQIDNLCFLNFLTAREDLSKLAGLKRGSLLRSMVLEKRTLQRLSCGRRLPTSLTRPSGSAT